MKLEQLQVNPTGSKEVGVVEVGDAAPERAGEAMQGMKVSVIDDPVAEPEEGEGKKCNAGVRNIDVMKPVMARDGNDGGKHNSRYVPGGWRCFTRSGREFGAARSSFIH